MNRLPEGFFDPLPSRRPKDDTFLVTSEGLFPATTFYDQLDGAIEEAFSRKVEEVEGRTISLEEARQFGYIQKTEKKPNELLVIWRGRPLLHIEWNEKRRTWKITDA